MGAAAVPLLIASTVISAGVSIHQSNVQQSALRAQAERNRVKARSQATAQEVDRLQKFRAAISNNIANAAASGFTIEGTPSEFIEAEISAKERDLDFVRAGAALTEHNINEATDSAVSSLNVGKIGAVAGAIGGIAGATSGAGATAANVAATNKL